MDISILLSIYILLPAYLFIAAIAFYFLNKWHDPREANDTFLTAGLWLPILIISVPLILFILFMNCVEGIQKTTFNYTHPEKKC